MATFRNNTNRRLMVPGATPPRTVEPDETFEVADRDVEKFRGSTNHFSEATPPKKNTAKKGDDA